MTVATAAQGGDKANTAVYVGTLPMQPENAVVRYRVKAHTTETPSRVVTSPRRFDPFDWHALFHHPRVATGTPIYHVFVTPRNWGELVSIAGGGRCTSVSELLLLRRVRARADLVVVTSTVAVGRQPVLWQLLCAPRVEQQSAGCRRLRQRGARHSNAFARLVVGWCCAPARSV